MVKQLPASVKFFSLLNFLLLSSYLHAQHNPVLESFTATQTNGKVFLTWVMSSGSTCNGIDILRSTDSLSFIPIGNIAGTCGSLTVAVTYQFTDNNPVKNKTNYYRLDLGGNGSSQIISVQIIDLSNGYLLLPNPTKNIAHIYFQNDLNQQHQLSFFSANAHHIKTLSTHQNFFQLNTTNMPSGIYFFTITNNANQIKARAKLVVEN
ncbi:MAG: T9SS type A sorting domain-containing protein [Bacteroidetes bacterium]|nr:T9SS type A sorting domain-containing protein [Bacteroidota bacterium]